MDPREEREITQKAGAAWKMVVGLASKVNEPLEERKKKEEDATAFVRRLRADMKEREKIQRLRNQERMLSLKEEMKDVEKRAELTIRERQLSAQERVTKFTKKLTKRA